MKPGAPFLEVVAGGDEHDAGVDEVLGAARSWAEPSAGNRERVTAALRGALPALGAGGRAHERMTGAVEPSVEEQGRAGEGARRRPESVRAGSGAARAPWWLVGGALIGALGFWLGHGVGYGDGQRDAAQARLAEALAARALLASPSAASSPAEVASSATAAALLATAPGAAPAGASPADPVSLAEAVPERALPAPPPSESARAGSATPAGARGAPRRSARAGRAARDARDAERDSARLSFRQVLDQLRRAQQQLRNGQATMSLLLLSELDRAAGDVLLEERDATRVLALCAVGQEQAARDVARRLEHSSPRSIYGLRLEASCVSDVPADDPSGSDPSGSPSSGQAARGGEASRSDARDGARPGSAERQRP